MSTLKNNTFIVILAVVLPGLADSTTAQAAQQLKIHPHEAADECNPDISQIRVTVNGVSFGGMLTVGLYDDPNHFLMRHGRKRHIRVPATGEQHLVCMNLDRHGTYAVSVYHDKDADRKLKRQQNMMPGEPFGLSNNPEPVMGYPKFSDSAFNTRGFGADITINLRQP
ncbi:Uncharacterized conserved protein, DUF2141 family [Nitrosomonas marina]|uniref:Uncharacterized conserved protein, DUF2141 family n=1 Tax=Nitrosomonas marina TaxID=917 RepID=A0A1H9Z162_9PROT|nr:DUF2141 domain-containing protein [Nitrosomonas marina]SES74597.1 Uncharacterized conserved protein, DUF2141 family [Nitrosomonas marina]